MASVGQQGQAVSKVACNGFADDKGKREDDGQSHLSATYFVSPGTLIIVVMLVTTFGRMTI